MDKQVNKIILETYQLTKSFGSFKAVDGVNLQVQMGEILGLLGPNGAGKSTLIKILTTLLPPSSGHALINGCDIIKEPGKVRRIIGYVPQMLSADGALTGYENLWLFAKLYDIPRKEAKRRVEEALEFMELSPFAKRLVRKYSGGMIRRLEIAQAMLHQPAVLFLDEPTIGLDPIGVKVVWDHIIDLKKKYNTTILLTTHIMEEAEKLCNRVALLSCGKIVACDTPAALKNSMKTKNATLEEAFIHYTSESPASEKNFREIQRERTTERRLS